MRRQDIDVTFLLVALYIIATSLILGGTYFLYAQVRFLLSYAPNISDKISITLLLNTLEIIVEGGMTIGFGIWLISFTPGIHAMRHLPDEEALLQGNPFEEKGFVDVDVLIPVKGMHLQSTENLFKDLQRQSYPREKTHVYLGLDRPTAKEEQAYHKLCKKYQVKLVILRENHSFKAGNLNNLLKHSSSPFFIIFDVDHTLFSWTVHDLVKAILNTTEHVAFVQGKTMYTGKKNTISLFGEMMYARYYEIAEHTKEKIGTTLTSGSTVIYKREYIEKIQGFAIKTYTEDVETATILMLNGYRGRYLNKKCSIGETSETYSKTLQQTWRWFHGPLAVIHFYGWKILRSKTLNFIQKLDLLGNGFIFILITSQFMFGLFLSIHYWLHIPFIYAMDAFPFTVLVFLFTVFMDVSYNFVAIKAMRRRNELRLRYRDIIKNEIASIAVFLPVWKPVVYGLMNWKGTQSKHASWNPSIRVQRDSMIYVLLGVYQIVIGVLFLLQKEMNGITIVLYGILFFIPMMFYGIYN